MDPVCRGRTAGKESWYNGTEPGSVGVRSQSTLDLSRRNEEIPRNSSASAIDVNDERTMCTAYVRIVQRRLRPRRAALILVHRSPTASHNNDIERQGGRSDACRNSLYVVGPSTQPVLASQSPGSRFC